ncbi:ZN658-like protein [Mya arenaria]|uniref:ZN658-like protein n=1 Tax=Mya arenaria TaxID=6604 RepID=A0ABY7DDK6_MYAAR|nr:ZN658-like protein [Mya arenaria]
MAAEERDIEETEEFTLAVKYVLKRQMKDLITQMREQGEEMVVMAVNIQDGTSTHFGTPLGDCFITEQKSLTNNFVTFCKSNGQKKSKAKTTLAQAEQMEILATSIIKQLENIPNVAQRKQVKVVLTNETADCQVRVELTGGDESCHKPASLKMATQGTTTDESVPWSTGVDMRMKRDVICTCGAIVSIYSTFGRKRQYMRDEELEEELRLNDLEEPSTPRHKSTPGTKYACGTCGKLFLKKSNCERHSRAHSDYKGVICNICGNAFTYENSLKHHMETEHGILKHVCKVCGKNYSNDTALKVHLIKTHGETLTGENLVMIVKERTEEGAGSLNEQMDEIMEGEGDGEDLEQLAGSAGMQQIQQGQTEHIVVTSRPDGSTERHIMLTGPEISSVSGEIMDGVSGQMVMSQADLNRITSGQIIVTQGEGGQVHVTSEDPSLDQDSAARIVEQAIQDGHVIAQDGNMSIIIKQMSTDTGEVPVEVCIDEDDVEDEIKIDGGEYQVSVELTMADLADVQISYPGEKPLDQTMDDSDMEYEDYEDEEGYSEMSMKTDLDEDASEGDGGVETPGAGKRTRKGRKKGVAVQVEKVICTICDKDLVGKWSLETHMGLMHNNTPCNVCKAICSGKVGLRKHLNRIHTIECHGCKAMVVESVPWKEGMEKTTTRIVKCQECDELVSIVNDEAEEFSDAEDEYIEMSDGDESTMTDTSFMSSGKKRRGFSETQILTCDYCNKKVTGKWSLQKHIERLHLKIRKYACDVCPEKYFDVTVLKKHKAKIHSIQCTKCGEEVNETEPWQEGIKQTDKRSVKCACGMNMMLQNEPPREPPTVETFIDEDGNVRKRKVKPTKRRRLEKIPMNCEYCGKTILGKWALRTHIQNMHLGAKGYECSICQMKFHSKASLKTHVIHVHTRQCKKCQTYVEESVPWPEGTERSMERIERCKCGANVVFCTNVGKRAHMGGVDEILIPDVIEEDQGRDETTDSPGYSVHIIRNRTQAEFQCNQCTKSFSHKKTLQNHVERIHSKVKHFGCSICPDTFFARKALELHVSSIHTKKCNKCERYLVETEVWGEGTHKCLRREMLCPCGETVAFQTARGLKQKINVDDDGGPTKVENGYACRHCGKLFQGKNRCIRHEMSHYTGEETVCSRCNADLRNTNDLKKHMETVHGYLFASCELCEKVFDSDPLLKLHVAKAHTGFIETGSHEQGTGTEEEYFGGEEELEEGEIKVENIQGLVQQSMAGDAELIQDMAADPEVEKVMSGLGPGQTMISQVEGGVIYVATRDSDLTTDGAREFVQQAIKDGHVTVPSGTISIILNKL